MKAFSVLTPALTVLALSFVACDSKSDTATTTQPSSTQDNTPSDNIDLSQSTPVAVPNWSLEDWMVPKFGVVTGASKMPADGIYSLNVSGATTANVESYRNVLAEHGMTKISSSNYRKDETWVNIGSLVVGPTKSHMVITIWKQPI